MITINIRFPFLTFLNLPGSYSKDEPGHIRLYAPLITKPRHPYKVSDLFFIFRHIEMRTQALILIFPFAVFLIETASFIPAMKDACTIVAAKKTSCCMKTKAADQCHNKKAADKKDPDNKCTNNPDCTTCPVCYTFIFQPQYEWPAQQFIFTKKYSLLNTSYISSYTSNVWKPPNGFFIL